MPAPPSARLVSTSSAPFKYVGGHVALDFVNTVDWTGHGPAHDRLTSYARLLEWAEGARVVSGAVLARRRTAARRDPDGATSALATALHVRRVLHRLFSAAAAGHGDDLALGGFHRELAGALAQRTVVPSPAPEQASHRPLRRFAWGWRDPHALDTISWSVLWDAAVLLASDDVGRLRICAGDDCGWMFVDHSRNGLRRWCEMDVCGMKEKNRRRATRPAPPV